MILLTRTLILFVVKNKRRCIDIYSWRISKYHPSTFDSDGRLVRDVWTEFQDIGRDFDRIVFSAHEYFLTEDLYVNMLLTFVKELRVDELQVTDLEHRMHPQKEMYNWDKDVENDMKNSCEEIFLNYSSRYPSYYTNDMVNLFYNVWEGQYLNIKEIEGVIRLVLRNHFWCRLSFIPRLTIDYLGKYYMVINSDLCCASVVKQIKKMGLFVESV